MKSISLRYVLFAVALGCYCVIISGCTSGAGTGRTGHIKDEAAAVGRLASSFPVATEDYFHDMDQNAGSQPPLSLEEVEGRNMWMVWTGGDDRLWDVLNWKSVGLFDLLKTVSSNVKTADGTVYGRRNRWQYLGLVNEPCFEEDTVGDPERFGLRLDRRVPNCESGNDPFADEVRYPGVKFAHRGEQMPVGSFYGYPTGIVGLRLFPNPNFDAQAKANWNAARYYENDPTYITKDLVRPYRIGMACSFCHVGPNPINPPTDPNNPKWANLSANVGAQYMWFDRVLAWNAERNNFFYQTLSKYQPGALDTSLVSTDYIENPRTMNAFYYLQPRLQLSKRWGHETLAGGGVHNAQFNSFYGSDPSNELNLFFEPPSSVWTPRILKDGSDSVGVLGALNRVYINIGLYSEEWLSHFNALFGGQKTTPIEITVARENSTYWNVTESWTGFMAKFFLARTAPHHLADAPGGQAYLSNDGALLTKGKLVFADRCARCHSSKAPNQAVAVDPGGCSGSAYLDCWNKYWAWTKTRDYRDKMEEIVLKADFLDNNYLSSELRVPVTLLKTNACSPLASNAIGGSIWDNFSSETYKSLPTVGEITYYHPLTGAPQSFLMPGNGRGYTRPPSLVSLWSTAPFLLNNTVGKFNGDPSVKGRMSAFQIAIQEMLWPEKRDRDSVIGSMIAGPSRIERTDRPTWIEIPLGFVFGSGRPKSRLALLKTLEGGNIRIGPIPSGFPVGLMSNLNLDPGDRTDLAKTLQQVQSEISQTEGTVAKEKLAAVEDVLLGLSKCPDLIVNRGHYFGTNMLDPSEGEPGLSDSEKKALIEFLKTF